MPLDHYVTLGHSGLRVSPLCLGTMTFGKEWGWGSEPRTVEQLDDNLGALDVKLTTEHVQSLDKATTPTLPFPTDMLAAVPTFAFGGTTIDGQPSQPWSQAPQHDSERF